MSTKYAVDSTHLYVTCAVCQLTFAFSFRGLARAVEVGGVFPGCLRCSQCGTACTAASDVAARTITVVARLGGAPALHAAFLAVGAKPKRAP